MWASLRFFAIAWHSVKVKEPPQSHCNSTLVICTERQLRWNWILSLHRSCKIKGDNNGDWNIPKWKSSYPRQAWSVPLSPTHSSLQKIPFRRDSMRICGEGRERVRELFKWVLKSFSNPQHDQSNHAFSKKRTWDYNNQQDLYTDFTLHDGFFRMFLGGWGVNGGFFRLEFRSWNHLKMMG